MVKKNSSVKLKKIGKVKKGGGGKEIAKKKNTDVPSTSSAKKR